MCNLAAGDGFQSSPGWLAFFGEGHGLHVGKEIICEALEVGRGKTSDGDEVCHNWFLVVFKDEYFAVGGLIDFSWFLVSAGGSDFSGVLNKLGLDGVVGRGSVNHE